jgi:hypothetical protein
MRRLEDRIAPPPERQIHCTVNLASRELAPDNQTCLAILEEEGFLGTRVVCVVDLCGLPDGLNAAELERYLREHGRELVSPRDPGVRIRGPRRLEAYMVLCHFCRRDFGTFGSSKAASAQLLRR